MCKGRLLSTMAHHIKQADISRKLQQEESRQPDEVSPSSERNLSSRGRSQGSLGVENSQNGTDRATEQSGPCNGTKQTVERNGTDCFTPFLGKRCRHATQMERTVLRTFFRRVP